MSNPEINSRMGMCIVPTSSSTVGVMQTNRVFCDFDLSTQYNSVHEIKDILVELTIQNQESKILSLTSTYAFYDLIQILIDDNVVEEIRSDNAFVDHQYYDIDTLSNYANAEGFGDKLVFNVPNRSFVPYLTISNNLSEIFYIIVPPNCISNKNIPLPLVSSTIKLRIYFKPKSLVLSDFDGTGKAAAGVLSEQFSVTSLSAILIGNKYDDSSLALIKQKYENKITNFKTLVHAWRTNNIIKPSNTYPLENKVSLNGKLSDVSFFIRNSDTSGINAAQYSYNGVAGTILTDPRSVYRLSNLTLKDSNGDYTNFYSDISGIVLNLLNNSKYNKVNSAWHSIFPIYTFKFTNDIFDTIATGNDNGSCQFNGNFNIIYTLFSDLSTNTYIAKSIELIMCAHQYATFTLDKNGKLTLTKN